MEGVHAVRVPGLSIFGLFLMIMAIAGCGTTYPPMGRQAANADVPYLIGPGDTVSIVVWRNPDLTMSIPVRPDGKISTPLVEDLLASGKTSTQLARDIEKALARYIQNPVVTVIVNSFVGTYSQQVRVIGEATKPQALPFRENMSLLDVMISVGGITDFADGNKASILRTSGGKTQRFGVRVSDLVRGGDLSADVSMRPGDVLVIPQSFF
jgi:polysaccharide biosynthesis/export protein